MALTVIRRARPEDALRIMNLYHEIYEGTYPDKLMSDFTELRRALASPAYCWIIAEDDAASATIAGSVVYRVDTVNLLSKVFGAAVRREYRGHNLTERLMLEGYELLKSTAQGAIEVVYATTRTIEPAPQKLTGNLGYRKLGIFPNIHKTDEYETHALTALFAPQVLEKRFTDFKLHPKIAPLFEIVRGECGLPPLKVATVAAKASHPPGSAQKLEFETIVAPKFVGHRFHDERMSVHEHHWFFPFQEPNILMTTPDQTVEVFAYYSEFDKHCALIGIRDVHQIGYVNIFTHACKALRELGARYIEFIVRADESGKIETALEAQFLPCAYFPAMQLSSGKRHDYVVFSRSFEILDFHNLKLEGVNRQYLLQYFNSWKEISLDPILL